MKADIDKLISVFLAKEVWRNIPSRGMAGLRFEGFSGDTPDQVDMQAFLKLVYKIVGEEQVR